MKEAGASACTDVTGFGLFAHLRRMLRPSELGAEIFADALPAFDGALDALRQGVIPGRDRTEPRICGRRIARGAGRGRGAGQSGIRRADLRRIADRHSAASDWKLCAGAGPARRRRLLSSAGWLVPSENQILLAESGRDSLPRVQADQQVRPDRHQRQPGKPIHGTIRFRFHHPSRRLLRGHL